MGTGVRMVSADVGLSQANILRAANAIVATASTLTLLDSTFSNSRLVSIASCGSQVQATNFDIRGGARGIYGLASDLVINTFSIDGATEGIVLDVDDATNFGICLPPRGSTATARDGVVTSGMVGLLVGTPDLDLPGMMNRVDYSGNAIPLIVQ